jgi:hypothetical protein
LKTSLYLFALQFAIWKPTLFLKCKPNHIWTNAFSIHVGPLWEANTNAQFILYPYATTTYCSFYLTKVDKSITREMRIIWDKCKCEKTKAFEQIKKLRNAFLNAQQMSIQQAIHICLSIPYIIQQDHSNS